MKIILFELYLSDYFTPIEIISDFDIWQTPICKWVKEKQLEIYRESVYEPMTCRTIIIFYTASEDENLIKEYNELMFYETLTSQRGKYEIPRYGR